MNKIVNVLKRIVKRSKLLTKIVLYFKVKLIFFLLIPKKNENKIYAEKRGNIFFEVVTNHSAFIEACKIFNIPYDENKCLLRFENNCLFYFMHNRLEYLAYGWSIEGSNFFLIEYLKVGTKIAKDNIILFDFMTNPAHRQKGHYKIILHSIIENFTAKPILIYTSPRNVGSIKGISANNFTVIGTYSKFTVNKCFRKLKKNNYFIKKSKSRFFVY